MDKLKKEALIAAYELSPEQVENKLRDHNWFTPEFVQDVRDNEKKPEFEPDCGPYIDPDIRDFPHFINHLEVYPDMARGFNLFLMQKCTTIDGHLIPLNFIDEIWDDELAKYAEELGHDTTCRYGVELNRSFIFELPNYTSILCAPERLRRTISSLLLNWGDTVGGIARGRDIKLLTAFISKALDVYLAKMDFQKKLIEDDMHK